MIIDQIRDVAVQPAPRTALASETSLRVAAAMLARAASDEMTATRVVGTLGRDDLDAFTALVAEVAEDYDLDSSFQLRGGSFAVRFARR
jgi:hypothetical protein